jgi:hypothetical protein
MGKCIGNDKLKGIDELRDCIVGIINELSSELELGGKIDPEIMEEHDKIVFPLLFRNAILDSLNKSLSSDAIFEPAEYECFREGPYNPEYVGIKFKKFPGCKILIGPFAHKGWLGFALIVDKKYHRVDSFRATGNYYNQRINTGKINFNNPIKDDKDMSSVGFLDFSNVESMEYYRKEKREFPNTLANRVAYYFSEIKIDDLGIVEFLEKYLG